MVFQNEILAGSSGSSASSVYKIDQSIRFNDDDSALMSRTPSQASSSQRAFTISFWTKRGNLTSGNRGLFAWQGANDNSELRLFFDDNQLRFQYIDNNSYVSRLDTSKLFRDVSSWYHVVAVSDTENAIATERWIIYVNGVRETAFESTLYPSQNVNIALFSSTSYLTVIGRTRSASTSTYDGYIAEINVLDGYAYDPSYFGETNENGIWVPKEYSGSYGTNGFYIKGADASNLGADSSPNGNNFTTSGLASNDQVPDSPTNNWCTWNINDKTPTSVQTISNGNLQVVTSGATSADGISGTQGITSGIWYWESRQQTAQVFNCYIGIKSTEVSNNKLPPTNTPDNGGSAIGYWGSGLYKDGSKVQDVTTSGNGDIVGIVVNLDASPQTVQFYRNGSTSGTAIQISSGFTWLPISSTNSSGYSPGTTSMTNFGQDSTFGGQISASTNTDANGLGNFKYSVPSNALAICTKNLGS